MRRRSIAPRGQQIVPFEWDAVAGTMLKTDSQVDICGRLGSCPVADERLDPTKLPPNGTTEYQNFSHEQAGFLASASLTSSSEWQMEILFSIT